MGAIWAVELCMFKSEKYSFAFLLIYTLYIFKSNGFNDQRIQIM